MKKLHKRFDKVENSVQAYACNCLCDCSLCTCDPGQQNTVTRYTSLKNTTKNVFYNANTM